MSAKESWTEYLTFAVVALVVGACVMTVGEYVIAHYLDYVVHFGLEATGSLIAIGAYKSHKLCKTKWHKFGIWFALSLLTTIVTVQLVG